MCEHHLSQSSAVRRGPFAYPRMHALDLQTLDAFDVDDFALIEHRKVYCLIDLMHQCFHDWHGLHT